MCYFGAVDRDLILFQFHICNHTGMFPAWTDRDHSGFSLDPGQLGTTFYFVSYSRRPQRVENGICTCLGLHRLHGSEGMERSTFDVQSATRSPGEMKRGNALGYTNILGVRMFGFNGLISNGFARFARFDSVLI